jgi:pyruvate, orthophosphate dikinase
VAEFFSYGTNDLTQTTFGISRDDAEKGFLLRYLEEEILEDNPFATIDEKGVGKLIEIGTTLGRKTRPDLEVGICGEHGGDPRSIDVLPPGRPRLRQLLAVPRAHRPASPRRTRRSTRP